jgi:hypothetical protein
MIVRRECEMCFFESLNRHCCRQLRHLP